MKIVKRFLGIAGVCVIAACNSGNGNGGHTGSTFNDLTQLANNPADGEPIAILDPQALQQDIAALLGKPDDEPAAVECGETDTVQSIIDRAALT